MQLWSTLASPKFVMLSKLVHVLGQWQVEHPGGGPPRFTNAEKIRNACSRLTTVINDIILTSILEKAKLGTQHCCCCGGRSILLLQSLESSQRSQARDGSDGKRGKSECKGSKR